MRYKLISLAIAALAITGCEHHFAMHPPHKNNPKCEQIKIQLTNAQRVTRHTNPRATAPIATAKLLDEYKHYDCHE